MKSQEQYQRLEAKGKILEVVARSSRRILKAKKWEDIIEDILASIGKVTESDRAYIFKNKTNSKEEEVAYLTYEWSRKGIRSSRNNPLVKTIPYKKVGEAATEKLLRRRKIMHISRNEAHMGTRLVMKSSGAKTILILPIHINNKMWGFVGLDRCRIEEKWNKEEVNAIKTFVSIISSAMERQHIQEELKQSTEKYEDIFENATELIQSVDEKGKFIYVNKAWKKTLGYTEEEVQKLTFTDIIDATDQKHCQKIFRELKDSRRKTEVQTVFVTKDKKRIFVKGTVSGKTKKGIFISTRGIFRDVSEELIQKETIQAINASLTQAKKDLSQFNKALEEKVKERTIELLDANKKLKELDKLKDTFISDISHELRTPMATIKLYNQLLLSGGYGELTKDQTEALNIMLMSANQQIATINNILDISRFEAGRTHLHKETFSIIQMIEEIEKEFFPQIAQEQAKITVKVQPKQATLHADKAKIQQIIRNLINNSIKYRSKKALHIQVLVKKQAKKASITIKDNGIGIAKKNQEKLFSKFYQVRHDSTIEGTGLGLSIVKHIVESHEGTIQVTSKTGQGTAITIEIPQ